MKYKMEISLLLIAIVFFGVSSFFYSYSIERFDISLDLILISYPYQIYAIGLVGLGSILMLVASLSFSRYNKSLRRKSNEI